MRKIWLLGCIATAAIVLLGTGRPVSAHPAGSARVVRCLGWRIAFARSMRLEASSSPGSGFVTISEVTLATFEPQRGIHTHVSHRDGAVNAWIRDYAPVDRAGSFPPSAVALRIDRIDGGPGVLPTERDTRLPLALSSFRPSGNLIHTPASVPRPRQRAVTHDGAKYAVTVWIGPRASTQQRKALAEMVAALRFAPP